MGIELRLCSRCGGKGILFDFDHRYNPKNKSIKFLKTEQGTTTKAECLGCGRYTKDFKLPIDAINSWNEGEIYNFEEYAEILAKEYSGETYSEEDVVNHIVKTDWNNYDAEICFINWDDIRIDKCEDDEYYSLGFIDFYSKDINEIISYILNLIKEKNLKVTELHYKKNK